MKTSKLIHSISSVFVAKIFSQVINTVSAIIIGRYVGAMVYGDYSYAMAIVSILSVFTIFGIDNSMLFFYSKYEKNRVLLNKTISFCMLLTTLLSGLAIMIVLLENGYLNVFIEPKYLPTLKTLIPLVFVTSINQVFYNLYRAATRVRISVLANDLIMPFLRLVILSGFVYLGKSQLALVLSIYLSSVSVMTLYIIAAHKSKIFRVSLPDRTLSKEIAKYSFPLFMAGAIVVVLGRMDVLFLGKMSDQKSIGIYNIAFQLSMLLSFVNVAVGTVFAPIISRSYHNNEVNTLKEKYKKISFLVFYATLFIYGFVAVYRAEILSVFGTEFILGSGAFFVLCTGQLINNVASMSGYMNSMTGHPEYAMYDGIGALVLNGFLNYLLIPMIGIVGAAIASASTILLRSVFHQIMVQRNLKMNVYSINYVKALVVFIVASAMTYWTRNLIGVSNVFMMLILNGLIYTVAFGLLSFKTLNIKECLEVNA